MDRHTSRHCYFRCLGQKLDFTRPSFCNLDPPQLSETNKLEGWHQLRSKHLRGNKLSLMGLGRGVSHWKCVSRALSLQFPTEKGWASGQWDSGESSQLLGAPSQLPQPTVWLHVPYSLAQDIHACLETWLGSTLHLLESVTTLAINLCNLMSTIWPRIDHQLVGGKGKADKEFRIEMNKKQIWI